MEKEIPKMPEGYGMSQELWEHAMKWFPEVGEDPEGLIRSRNLLRDYYSSQKKKEEPSEK